MDEGVDDGVEAGTVDEGTAAIVVDGTSLSCNSLRASGLSCTDFLPLTFETESSLRVAGERDDEDEDEDGVEEGVDETETDAGVEEDGAEVMAEEVTKSVSPDTAKSDKDSVGTAEGAVVADGDDDDDGTAGC